MRFVSFSLLLLMIGACALKGNSGLRESASNKTTSIDGVYDFVSETTMLTKPETKSIQRTSNDWVGVWCFHGDRFNYEMMFKRRPPFPKTMHDLGYRSGVGRFELKDNNIILQPTISLDQVELLQSKTLDYKIQDRTLTLIENMTPYMENQAEGQRTTILRKVD